LVDISRKGMEAKHKNNYFFHSIIFL